MAVFTGEVKGYFEIWVHKGNQEDKGGIGKYYVKSKPQGVFVCFVFGFFFVVFCAPLQIALQWNCTRFSFPLAPTWLDFPLLYSVQFLSFSIAIGRLNLGLVANLWQGLHI